jgi:hypothetical protein
LQKDVDVLELRWKFYDREILTVILAAPTEKLCAGHVLLTFASTAKPAWWTRTPVIFTFTAASARKDLL